MTPTTPMLRRLAAAVLLAAVAAVIVAGLLRVRIDTSIESFVPRGDDSYTDLVDRDQDYGADPIVVVLHGTTPDGLLLDDSQLPQLVGLEGTLANLDDVAVVYGPGTVLNQTARSMRNVLAQVSGRRDAIANAAEAEARDRGLTRVQTEQVVGAALADFDERYGALLTQAMPMGLPSVSNRAFVASALFGKDGEPRAEWDFLVPDAKSATILVRPREGLDQEQTAALVRTVRDTIDSSDLEADRPTVTGVPVITAAVSEQARDEAPTVGLIALGAVSLVFLLVPWSRRRRDRLRPLLATALGAATTLAIFGWLDRPMSLAVVAFLPIVIGIGSDFPLYLAQPSERRRVLVAAGAAAAAFATLWLSPLPFVGEFGLALSLAVAATAGWALVLGGRLGDIEAAAPGRRRMPRPGWAVTSAAVAAAVLAGVAGWCLLPGLAIESSPQQLAAGLPELEDVRTAEDTLGFSGEVSIVVRGPDVLSPEVLEWTRQAEETAVEKYREEVRPLLTLGGLLEFLGPDATGDQVQAGAGLLPPYLLGAVVNGDGTAASSTFGIELDDLDGQAALIDQLEGELSPPPDGYEAEVVGLPVVASSGLDEASSGPWVIGLTALVTAALIIGLALRSVRLGLTVLTVSLVASGWVFLGDSLLGAELSPLTIAVGALITVTSCEFCVMLDSAARDHRPELRRSVAVAALAGTAGYCCLAASDLAVLRAFGLTLAAGVAASYVAARILVGALSVRRPEQEERATAKAPAHQPAAMRVKESV
jgi:uncharacterized protein